MGFTLAPLPKLQFLDANGAPYAGGLLYTYAAGTSTPLVTYADNAGTPNANPVVLDSAGRATVYLGASAYKVILKDSGGATVYTQDNILEDFATVTGTQTLQTKTLDDSTIISGKDSNFTIEKAADATAKAQFAIAGLSGGQTRIVSLQQWGQGASVAAAGDLTLGVDGNSFLITGGGTINAVKTANWANGSILTLTF